MINSTMHGSTTESFTERMSLGLKRLGIEIKEVEWFNPVPHVWSLNIVDTQCALISAQGRGITPESALTSALSQVYERLGTHRYFADYYFGSHFATQSFVHYPFERWFPATSAQWPSGLLDEHSLNHYDPDDELSADMLIDFNSGQVDKGVCALPFERQSDGETVWFPVNVLDNLYAFNGTGVGEHRYEARVNALASVFERHVKTTIISNAISLPRIPAKIIAGYPRLESAIKALRVKGFVVDVRDASLGGQYPLVSVSILNRKNGGCLTAFGAHPKFAQALEHALTGLLQGKTIDALDEMPEPTFDLAEVASPQNLENHLIDSSGRVAWDLFCEEPDYPFTPWNIEGSPEQEYEALCQLIHAADLQVYLAEYPHLGVDTCRIIVPGMSEIHPVSHLMWRNNNAVAGLRDSCLTLEHIDVETAGDLLDELEQLDVDNAQQVAKLIGIAADPDTAWYQLNVGDLKLRLALCAGELEVASRYTQWATYDTSSDISPNRLSRCLSELISIALDTRRDLSAFERPLKAYFGEDVFQASIDMLNGQGLFTGLGLDSQWQTFKRHQSLMSVYKRIHESDRVAL